MRVVDILIPSAWAVFWVYWLAAALLTKVTRIRSTHGIGIRLALIVVVVVLVRSGVLGGHGTAVHAAWMQGTGLAMCAAGFALAVWARAHLGRNWGTPMSEKVEPELVTSGPYRLIRHPIYSGFILAGIGTAFATNLALFAVVAVVSAYFVYAGVVEERTMLRLFPDAYPLYKGSTTMFVPFLF